MEDVKSDLSAFHRVDRIEDMDGRDFCHRSRRLFAYKGVLRMKAEEEAEKEKKSPTGRERNVGEKGVTHYKDIKSNPEIAQLGLFEAGTG
jgi:hypothetical protein